MTDKPIFGGIEFGGTKTVVAVGEASGEILASSTLPTVEPSRLIDQILEFFAYQAKWTAELAGLGIGAFGPIALHRNDPRFGHLLETNKQGWSGFDLAGELSRGLPVPQALMTDVAAAGIGEAAKGALQGIETGIYLTVGTGIGGAILQNGLPLTGLMHPEIGHLPVVRLPNDEAASTCRFHSSCAEGLAAGPAITARFGKPLSAFGADSDEVAFIGNYIGQLIASLVLTVSPERIVVGGGVSQCSGLLTRAEQSLRERLSGYGASSIAKDRFLVPPSLGPNSGIVGALIAAGRLASRNVRGQVRKSA